MVRLEKISLDDLDQLAALEKALFVSDRISRRQFRYLLTRGRCLLVKAVDSTGVLLGYLALLFRQGSSKLRLYSLAVAVEARGQGVARQLLDYCLAEASHRGCREVVLEVCEHNHQALRLYAAAGFQQRAVQPGYYEDGCTARRLYKRIEDHTQA